MPNIITHILFAEDIQNQIEDDLKERISNNEQLFKVGSNGPDFCFFYGLTLTKWEEKVPIAKLGNLMHAGHVNDFYKMCLDRIQNEKNETIKEDMIVYTWGHLCHWALDSTTHPYVMYRTGDCKGRSGWWHHRFESCLDAIMLKVKKDLTTKDFKAKEICIVPVDKARAITRIYVPYAHQVFNMNDIKASHIYQSLQDWAYIQTVLYDANGTKYKIVYTLEKPLGLKHLASGLLVPNEPIDDYDIINLLHTKWVHPCDDTKVSTDSFFDLYDQALKVALNAVHLFNLALENENNEKDFFNFIQDKNYNLGINKDLPMKYFDRIQDKN